MKRRSKAAAPTEAHTHVADTTNEIIRLALKATNSDVIEDYLAGVCAGFLTGYKRPVEPFVGKLTQALAAFSKVTKEISGLHEKLRDTGDGPKVAPKKRTKKKEVP